MSDRDILEHAAAYFKSNHPHLTAESIVCFLVLIDLGDGCSVAEVARAVGMSEPNCHRQMAQLNVGSGAGLVALENMGDGRNIVHLSTDGEITKNALESAFS